MGTSQEQDLSTTHLVKDPGKLLVYLLDTFEFSSSRPGLEQAPKAGARLSPLLAIAVQHGQLVQHLAVKNRGMVVPLGKDHLMVENG